MTSLPFLGLGVWGLLRLHRAGALRDSAFFDWAGFWASAVLLAFGSAIFHWHPTPRTLALDRAGICGATAFMTAHAVRLGFGIAPSRARSLALLGAGLAAIAAWLLGTGTLLDGGVREAAMSGALGMFAVARWRGRLQTDLMPVALFVVLFGAAKLAEAHDQAVLSWTGFIAGHPIKHVLAALAMGSLGLIMRAELADAARNANPDAKPQPLVGVAESARGASAPLTAWAAGSPVHAGLQEMQSR